ncbi:MAG: helix-turn-helix domain-containing protein [Fibrobacterota bacterium]|nr:helix-turn-helix domain-containing protein [Fibrobacterota bacterium]
MAEVPSIYIDLETVYHADKCEPLSMAAEQGELRLWNWGRGTYPGKRLGADALQEICSIGVWDATKKQNWGLDWHRNEGLEITYLEQGGLAFSVDDWEGRMRPGHFTVTRPWQKHRVGDPLIGSSRLHWLILDLGVRQPHTPWRWPDWLVLSQRDLAELTENLRGNERPVWTSSREMESCFKKIAVTLKESEQASLESRLKVQLNELFLSILDLQRNSDMVLNPDLSSAQRTVNFFLASLPKHLDFPWDLKAMAKQCGMARSQFTMHCRNLTNCTPMQFLVDARIEAAKAMLSERLDLNISDISGLCGFQTSQYFATQFRKRAGAAPAEYRKRSFSNSTL